MVGCAGGGHARGLCILVIDLDHPVINAAIRIDEVLRPGVGLVVRIPG